MEAELSTSALPESGAERAIEIYRRVLVPVDFSHESHDAIYMALELRRRFGSEICVFNLTNLGVSGDEYSTGDLEIDGRDRLLDLLEMLKPGCGGVVQTQVCVGEDVARWIHDVATAWQATLVVLATHPSHTVFRNLTEKIMRALNVPILILR